MLTWLWTSVFHAAALASTEHAAMMLEKSMMDFPAAHQQWN